MMTPLTPNKFSQIDRFFSALMSSRDIAHIHHLYSIRKSYSMHETLKHYYLEINRLLDELIEGYTGIYVAPEIVINISQVASQDPIKYFKKLYDLLKEAYSLFTDKWIHSVIDEISKLTALTIYKLEYLK